MKNDYRLKKAWQHLAKSWERWKVCVVWGFDDAEL